MRAREEMPGWIEQAIAAEKLREAYDSRPPYQRNDYLIWIVRAKRDDTRRRRLAQMLHELRRGDVYMKMPWSPRHR